MLQSLQAVVREARIAECSPAVKACCRQYPPLVRTPRIDVARKSWGKLNSPHSPEVATTLNHFLDGHRMPFRLSTPSVLTTTRLLLCTILQDSCLASRQLIPKPQQRAANTVLTPAPPQICSREARRAELVREHYTISDIDKINVSAFLGTRFRYSNRSLADRGY